MRRNRLSPVASRTSQRQGDSELPSHKESVGGVLIQRAS